VLFKAPRIFANTATGFLSDGINCQLVGKPREPSAEPDQQTSGWALTWPRESAEQQR